MDFFGGIIDSIKDTVGSVDDLFGMPVTKGLGKAGMSLLADDKARAEAARDPNSQISGRGIGSRGGLSRPIEAEGSDSFRQAEIAWSERLNKFRRMVEETKQSVK